MIIQNFTGQAVIAPVEQPSSTAEAAISKADSSLGDAVNSPSSSTRQISPDELRQAASLLNQVMQQSNSSLQFSVDTDTNTPIVRLVDTNTGELIRQIPSEEALAISRSIDQALQRQGLLCKQVA